MERYLYGASVQGIQSFIFQTNKLREIVGASELVEQICSKQFDDFAKNGDSIVRAAGKVICIFEKKKDCEDAVRKFPRKVMCLAPGITISQAVVKYDDDNYEWASNELEQRLRVQRNRPIRSLTLGLIAISRDSSTGFSAVKKEKGGLIDEASVKKTDNGQKTRALMIKLTGDENIKHENIAYDFNDLEGKNSWIAVIHADGNGIGNIVQQVCKNPKDAKAFSKLLNDITEASAKEAYKAIENDFEESVIPIRPIVLGGDDLTVICRADLAIKFTQKFLEAFENESKKRLEILDKYEITKKGLTACTGIAFVKSSYPFHYAIDLAEDLCKRAKGAARMIDANLAPSCLMFHKVQDTFVDDFKEIVERELTPQAKLSFEYGPYYCKVQEKYKDNTIGWLVSEIEKLNGKEGNAIKSHLRQWMSLLFDNVDAANQKMKRLRAINDQARATIPDIFDNVENVTNGKIPYYDILSLSSILTQDTKKGGTKL
jgi:hypothetical protein